MFIRGHYYLQTKVATIDNYYYYFRQHYTIWPFKPLYFRHVRDFIHVFTASNYWIYIILIGSILLPPATKLGQGNIFRSVCQEFCSRGGGVCLIACWETTPPGPEADTPPGPEADTPRDQRQAPPGRYASYWNAILF